MPWNLLSGVRTETGKQTDTEASFLDLDIKFLNKKFSFNVYDKRDSFPFFIATMAYLRSNILSKLFSALDDAEIIRIPRIATEMESFKLSCAKIKYPKW